MYTVYILYTAYTTATKAAGIRNTEYTIRNTVPTLYFGREINKYRSHLDDISSSSLHKHFHCQERLSEMSDSLMIASDENAKQNPNLDLAHRIFLIENNLKRNENIEQLRASVLADIVADSMAKLYTELNEKYGWQNDEALVNDMISANKASIIELDQKIVDATENAGDTEVRLFVRCSKFWHIVPENLLSTF